MKTSSMFIFINRDYPDTAKSQTRIISRQCFRDTPRNCGGVTRGTKELVWTPHVTFGTHPTSDQKGKASFNRFMGQLIPQVQAK